MNRFLISALIVGIFALFLGCDSNDPDPVIVADLPVIVTVKLKIGDVVYDNVDGTVTAIAYNEKDELMWAQDYFYTGGEENVIEVPRQFHHFRFRVDKWGIFNEQVFTILELQEISKEGSNPTPIVLGGETAAKRLASFEILYEGSPGAPSPEKKFFYEYDVQKRLSKITDALYNSETRQFDPYQYVNVTYENNKISRLERYQIPGDAFIEKTSYQYNSSGKTSQIIVENFQNSSTTTIDIVYDLATGNAKATFHNADQTVLDYEMTIENDNIVADRSVSYGFDCKVGNYTFDKRINPLRHLGYLDPEFKNFSISNKLTESVTYNCSIPVLKPASYQNSYDEMLAYPNEAVITYEGGSKGKYIFQYELN